MITTTISIMMSYIIDVMVLPTSLMITLAIIMSTITQIAVVLTASMSTPMHAHYNYERAHQSITLTVIMNCYCSQ